MDMTKLTDEDLWHIVTDCRERGMESDYAKQSYYCACAELIARGWL